MFIPDLDFFPIKDQGSKKSLTRGPGSAIKNLEFLTQRNVTKLLEIWSGMFLLDLVYGFFFHPWSQIQGSKTHRIPDSEHWYRIKQMTRLLQIQIGLVGYRNFPDPDLDIVKNPGSIYFLNNLELWKSSSNYCRPCSGFKHISFKKSLTKPDSSRSPDSDTFFLMGVQCKIFVKSNRLRWFYILSVLWNRIRADPELF
jgi:hypothetical protein